MIILRAIASAGVLLLLIVACAAPSAYAQKGVHMGPAGSPLTGSFIVPIVDADTWVTGSNNTIRVHLKTWGYLCNDLVVYVYVGTIFWSVTVVNQYACHCDCGGQISKLGEDSMGCCMHPDQGGNKDPPASWTMRHIYPYSITFYDVSKAATIILATRENTPKNLPLEAFMFTIPNALDKRLVTPKMTVNITFHPRETNIFMFETEDLLCGIPECEDGFKTIDWTQQMEKQAMNQLGFYFKTRFCEVGLSTLIGGYYLHRKPPIPSLMFKLRRGPKDYDSNPAEQANWWTWVYSYIGQSTDVKSINRTEPGQTWAYSTEVSTWRGCYASGSGSFFSSLDGKTSLLVAEFYEDKRFLMNEGTFSLADVKNQISNVSGAPAVMVPLNGSHPMSLRIQWTSLVYDEVAYPHHTGIEAAETFAMFLTQPFPIQDLWIEIHDQNDNRIFVAVERHVPYRLGSTTGLIGYFYALRMRLHTSDTVTVTVKYNRRQELGASIEEEKARLLEELVLDQGGHVDFLLAPIPKTVEPKVGVMGALASADATTGDVLAHIHWRTLIPSNTSWDWIERTLLPRLNASEEFFQAFWNNTTPYHKELVTLSMYLITRATAPADNATNGWVYMDSFYPEQPTMLPHFYDPQTLDRLYGHTELVNFINADLAQWSAEHAAIGRNWSWWAADIAVHKYQWMRAHVRRSARYTEESAILVPFVNFLRHSPTGTSNCEIVFNKWQEYAEIVATTSISENDEIIPDFDAPSFSKHEFMLHFGEVPVTSAKVATIPGYPGFLHDNWDSRNEIVDWLMTRHGEDYRDALGRLLTMMNDKIIALPTIIDGLGSTPDMVNQATQILAAERDVLQSQFSNSTAEYATLPVPATPAPTP